VIPFQIRNIYFYSVLSFSVLLYQSCKETPSKPFSSQTVTEPAISVQKTPEQQNHAIPSELAKWSTYHSLYKNIKNLETDILDLLNTPTEDLNQLFVDLKKSIPNALNETSILTRLTVLETLTHKLRESYSLELLDTKEFNETKIELIQAQTNLIFQINKTLEKKAQQITKPE